MTIFHDRQHAGRQLAAELAERNLGTDPIVLGLARGGVPVAYEIARHLKIPLDAFVVRKLGVPFQPELAFGAIASGDVRILNDDVLRVAGITQQTIEEITWDQRRELIRREEMYRAGAEPHDFSDRTVILADDGIATGATMAVAVEALRSHRPEVIIGVVPVGSRAGRANVGRRADDLICLHTPEPFMGVGAWYDDFRETTDEDVRALLKKARS